MFGRRLSLLLVSLWMCVVLPGLWHMPPASAQSQTVLDNIEANSDGWDTLIQGLLQGQSTGLVSQLWLIASLTGAISILFYCGFFAKGLLDGKETLRGLAGPFVIVLFMLFLLGSPGSISPASRMAFGTLQIKDRLLQNTLESSIAGQQLGAAVSDELLSATIQAELRERITVCDRIAAVPVVLTSATRPTNPDPPLTPQESARYDQLECYQNVQAEAERRIAEVPQQCVLGDCAATIRQLERVRDGLIDIVTVAVNPAGGLAQRSNILTSHAVAPVIMFVAFQIQRFYIHALNASYFLHILILKVVLASSLTPRVGSGSLFSTWLGTFFGTMLAEFYYVILVSTSSLILESAQTSGSNDDLLTSLVLGIFSPALSGYLARGSASGAIRGISSATGQVATSIPVVGGSIASFARYRSG